MPLPGTICLHDLQLDTVIGVHPHEQTGKQRLLLDLSLTLDLGAACRQDDLSQTVDYEALASRLVEEAAGRSFKLIEAVAALALDLALADPRVQEATVRVRKPTALRQARTIAVEITRRR